MEEVLTLTGCKQSKIAMQKFEATADATHARTNTDVAPLSFHETTTSSSDFLRVAFALSASISELELCTYGWDLSWALKSSAALMCLQSKHFATPEVNDSHPRSQ